MRAAFKRPFKSQIFLVSFLAIARIVQNVFAVAETESLLINGSAVVRVANVFSLETVRTGAIRCREGRGGAGDWPDRANVKVLSWFALPPLQAHAGCRWSGYRVWAGIRSKYVGGLYTSRKLSQVSYNKHHQSHENNKFISLLLLSHNLVKPSRIMID